MKKTLLLISALLLVCLAFYGWKPLLQPSSNPQMEAYYRESANLGSVPADSASRFIANFLGYSLANPSVQLDPLYPEIEKNMHKYSLMH
jgi:hypothetical protein